MLRVSSGWYVYAYVCVYDFRVFRPRVSPFHRVHACFAAMCRKDCRVLAGSRNSEEGSEGGEGREGGAGAARDVEWWWASRGAGGKEGEARNACERERGSAGDRSLYSVLVRLPAGYLRWMRLTVDAFCDAFPANCEIASARARAHRSSSSRVAIRQRFYLGNARPTNISNLRHKTRNVPVSRATLSRRFARFA